MTVNDDVVIPKELDSMIAELEASRDAFREHERRLRVSHPPIAKLANAVAIQAEADLIRLDAVRDYLSEKS